MNIILTHLCDFANIFPEKSSVLVIFSPITARIRKKAAH